MSPHSSVLRATLSGDGVELEVLAVPADGLAAAGGSALALALVAEWSAPLNPSECLALAVGRAVERRLPSAARAVVGGVAPLGGRYAEGQIGGGLAAALGRAGGAAAVSGLLVRGRCGRTGGPPAVLCVGRGRARLEPSDGLAGRAPEDLSRALSERFGPGSSLCVGPAALAGLPFASLASGDGRQSFVGRGGLGLRLAELGLLAIHVEADPAGEPRRGPADPAAAELAAALMRSPRLAARAQGGTLELLGAFAAAGDLTRADGRAAEPALAGELLEQIAASPTERHGCRGCPTPCGLSFGRGTDGPGGDGARAGGAKQAARFGASDALGVRLGFERFEASLELLERCDALGLDAKEMGAALGVYASLCDAGQIDADPGWGNAPLLRARIDETLGDRGAGRLLRAGSAALGERFDWLAHTPVARGQAVRPVSDLASLLGQCVSSAGGDPMRSFPFLGSGGSVDLLRELAPELDLPPGAEDPSDPAGKGALVWWHENLTAALDATGFCAFSAAGLLADRVLDLDGLGQRIAGAELLGDGGSGGVALLELGRRIVDARFALDARLGADDSDPAPFARAQLALPGMLDVYRRLRSGAPEPERRADAPQPRGTSPARPGPGVIELLSSGPLAEAAGASVRVEVEGPMPVSVLLERLAQEHPAVRPLLLAGTAPIVGVWREGRLLQPDDAVAAGERVQLLAVIAGG